MTTDILAGDRNRWGRRFVPPARLSRVYRTRGAPPEPSNGPICLNFVRCSLSLQHRYLGDLTSRILGGEIRGDLLAQKDQPTVLDRIQLWDDVEELGEETSQITMTD